MNKEQILQNTTEFVKETLANAEGGHDWFHIERVTKNANQIAKKELADSFVVELAALLHDIADSKFHKGDESIAPKKARAFLNEQGVSKTVADHVVQIVTHVSFKGGNFEQEFHSKELEVVQDADRLDALGAIGIARCFGYGGFKKRALYDPKIKPELSMTKEEYKKSTAPSINHFYEKLLLLKDRMHTDTGRKIATERHRFMELFLAQFYAEWNGTL